MDVPITRREALLAATTAFFAASASRGRRSSVRVEPPYAAFLGDALMRGHRARDVDPTKLPIDGERRVDVLIVGAGFAGLSAATALKKAGLDSFLVVELDDVVGGLAQRRAVGGARIQFGPLAFDGPPLENATAADGDVASFLAATAPGTASRRARIARDDGAGGWTEADVGGEGAELGLAALGAAGALGAIEDLDAATWCAGAAPSASARFDAYCRARFGARPENLGAAPVVADFLRRGPRCGGLRLFPEGGVGAAAERAAAALGDRLLLDHVVLKCRKSDEGVVAYVIDPRTNAVTLVRARAAIVAVPPFAAKEIAPELGADGRFVGLGEWSVWLETAIGLPSPSKGFPTDTDLVVPSLAHPTALAAWFPRVDPAPEKPDPLRPAGFLLLKRPFTSARTTPSRIMLSRTPPWDLRDYVFRDLAKLFPDVEARATRVDLLRVGHGGVRPSKGPLRDVLAKLGSTAPPFFPCGADWTGTPSLYAAIGDGARAARAAAAFVAADAESRPR